MGAFEYQRVAPTAVATATPGSVEAGIPATFSATGSSDPNPGDTLSYSWTFDDGATASGPTVTHSFATAGTHTATLDRDGAIRARRHRSRPSDRDCNTDDPRRPRRPTPTVASAGRRVCTGPRRSST